MAAHRSSRTRRPPALRVAFGIVFAAALLLTVELGLRIAGVRPAYRVEDLGQWRVTGGLSAHAVRGPRDGHSFTMSTNADGLRTTLPTARTPGRARIALMGDSTVFGWGVDDGGTVAEGAQAGLGDGYEVLNAGQPGYSTTMQAWLFDEVLQAYTPDLTIAFIPMHDTNLVLVSDREVLQGGATWTARARVTLAQQSSLYQAVRGLIFDYTDKAWLLPDEAADEPRVPRVSDAERTQALDDMRATAARWGGRVAIGYLPFKADFEHDQVADRPTQRWAEAYAAEHGVALVDVRACCLGRTGMVLEDDPGHLTRDGNLAAGAAIAQAVLQRTQGASP